MTKRTLADLVAIAQFGGGFELSATDYTQADLVAVADALCAGATLRLRNTDKLTTVELSLIAQHGGPGAVEIVLV